MGEGTGNLCIVDGGLERGAGDGAVVEGVLLHDVEEVGDAARLHPLLLVVPPPLARCLAQDGGAEVVQPLPLHLKPGFPSTASSPTGVGKGEGTRKSRTRSAAASAGLRATQAKSAMASWAQSTLTSPGSDFADPSHFSSSARCRRSWLSTSSTTHHQGPGHNRVQGLSGDSSIPSYSPLRWQMG